MHGLCMYKWISFDLRSESVTYFYITCLWECTAMASASIVRFHGGTNDLAFFQVNCMIDQACPLT